MHDLTLFELQIMLNMFQYASQNRGQLTVTEQDIHDRLLSALAARVELEDMDLMSACEGCFS
jgi:hypothetical protein